jgi:hypothetical protein
MEEDEDLDEEQRADLDAIRQRKKQIISSHRCGCALGGCAPGRTVPLLQTQQQLAASVPPAEARPGPRT